jgi:cyclophilin family peptidyl-prolyl cis-trans isomerase
MGPQPATLAEVSAAAGKPVSAKHHVVLKTTQGDITIALFSDVAPGACAKFLSLVVGGIYDGTTYHRVIPGFVAQGGDPNSVNKPANDPTIGSGGYGAPVPDDFANGLKHLPGALAFAHSSAPNSSSSQYYICLARLSSLDGGYTVFGQTVAGYDVALKLAATERAGVPTGATPDRVIKATQSD